MKLNTLLTTLFVILFCFSCKKDTKSSYILAKADKTLSFQLDNDTKNSILFLMPYKEEKTGKEYLTFQNETKNQILFYDMNTFEFEFKIEPEMDGYNGVGRFLGYYIHNLDSIYLTSYDFQEISLINKESTVLSKINYERDKNGNELSFFCFITHFYRPASVIGEKIYIYSSPNRYVEKAPVAAVLDIKTETIEALPFSYPNFPNTENKTKKYGFENDYSRCYDGKNFIYSFFYEENIYVTPPSHDTITNIKIKSKYIDHVKWPNDYGVTPKELCENPKYGNLLYDEYRNIYYRVAYPKTNIDEKKEKVRCMELMEYGGKRFSIIVLDKNFNILCENIFADYTYNPEIMFIKEDGLYISTSHYMNPDFSDDILSFQRFDLIKIKESH